MPKDSWAKATVGTLVLVGVAIVVSPVAIFLTARMIQKRRRLEKMMEKSRLAREEEEKKLKEIALKEDSG